MHKVVENGERKSKPRELDEIAGYSRERLNKLPDEFKRFENPHIYKVGLSGALKEKRDHLVDHYKQRVNANESISSV